MNPLDISASWYDTAKSRKRNALEYFEWAGTRLDKYPNVKREYEKARDRFEKDGR